jgi:hypothetical protein
MSEEQVSRKSKFDRAMGALVGIPDVLHSKPTTVRALVPIIGDAQTFIIQTFRQRDGNEEGAVSDFTVFVEYVDDVGTVRLVLPPAVSRVIARQRDALTDRARSKTAKAVAEERKARGEVPGFMRKRAAKRAVS